MTGSIVGRNQIHEVVVVGAGSSGICAGIKLRENTIENFLILEKTEGVGGSWWANRYPGSQCDVPSHLYCYSFEMNPGCLAPFGSAQKRPIASLFPLDIGPLCLRESTSNA